MTRWLLLALASLSVAILMTIAVTLIWEVEPGWRRFLLVALLSYPIIQWFTNRTIGTKAKP